jgi:hypothetical protein
MKLSVLAILITLWASHLVGAWANDGGGDDDDHHHHHHHHSARATPTQGRSFHGTPFPPSPQSTGADDESPGRSAPTGTPRGPINPSSPGINLRMGGGTNGTNTPIPRTKRQQCGGNSIAFDTSTVFGSGGQPSEPSGAKAGQVIFTTANSFAAISIDGGATFNSIDATVYAGPGNPATDAGFCCDQSVQYLPSIDRFVWLMLYRQTRNAVNRFRLVTFHPSDVDTKKINSWIYVDILSTDLGFTNYIDFPDMAVGNSQLYVSITDHNTGFVVVRIPIDPLGVIGTFTYHYTDVGDGSNSQFSHATQNALDTVYWAGHSTVGTELRIFQWPESSTSYSWAYLRIDDWPSDPSKFTSTCPGNTATNWLFRPAFPDIIGATRRSTDEVWFAWAAPSGGGFPNAHVQIAQIGVGNWPNPQLNKQWQIWNADFAFAYPTLFTNQCGDVGLAVAFGGGGFNPTGALGIADSDGVVTQTVYYPELSDVCEDRFGDYFTVRQGVGSGYSGFVYAEQSSGDGGIQRNPRFVEFARE